jgi:hypothetical protein
MLHLNPRLLQTNEFADEFLSSPINGTNSRGVYNPMQFVLRLREDIHKELESLTPGVYIEDSYSPNQLQAFSTYLHETIHWWQHVGSNFGLIFSLKFPAQSHIIHSDLKIILDSLGAFKSIKKFDQSYKQNTHINKVLNYWSDIEFAGQIAFDHKRIFRICKDPYFECWGHSYSLMWSSAIWCLAATVDKEFSFLPNIKDWEEGFNMLRDKKVRSFYYGSPNTIPPLGIRAIFEGQARFCQLQYLSRAFKGNIDLDDFAKTGMLSGIYVEGFNLFLKVLNEKRPNSVTDPLIALFLLICDIAINPTDGFPFTVTHPESFIIITNDPGYRFSILCQIIRDKFPELKQTIKNYSREEYIEVSEKITHAMSCLSPFESSVMICDWIQTHQEIKSLLEEEKVYSFLQTNQPIRLFFSKFLRFQEDKVKYPQAFCWPGMNFINLTGNTVDLPEMFNLFEKHKALFTDDIHGNIYHSAHIKHTPEQLDQTLNDFFTWNSVYDLTRQWVSKEGPFSLSFDWLSSKYSKSEMESWVSNNFESVYSVGPDMFQVL